MDFLRTPKQNGIMDSLGETGGGGFMSERL